jgi:cysteine desulfurase
MTKRRVYLDHLSGTPPLPEVVAAMRPYFEEHFGNPSALHQLGLRAREALAQARQQVAAFIHAESPDEIIFTSGGTEALNLAIKGVAFAAPRRGNHFVVSAIEHPAVLNSVEFLQQQGFQCTQVRVDSEGGVDPGDVRAAIRGETILIAVHYANHDLGTVQPVREISALAAERGIPLLVDATVSGGWLPVDVQRLGASLLALSPHRFYGPKGVGVLYRHRRARLASLIHGGGQESGRRSGTENVPAIVGAGVAAAAAQRELSARVAHTTRLQAELWAGLQRRIACLRLNGPPPGPKRLSTNLNFSSEFIEGEAQMLRLDLQGIAVASGSSCLGKAGRVSHVLAAIGLDRRLAQGALLVSLGKDNTREEMDYFVETFAEVVEKLRGLSPLWDEFQRGLIDSVARPRRPPGG